jgi:hypothetical protein
MQSKVPIICRMPLGQDKLSPPLLKRDGVAAAVKEGGGGAATSMSPFPSGPLY